jgi:hypothetical protein
MVMGDRDGACPAHAMHVIGGLLMRVKLDAIATVGPVAQLVGHGV